MTGLEFLAAGLSLKVEGGGRLVPLGPKGETKLLNRLRFEIATRIPLVGDGQTYPLTRRDARPPLWCCDVCGDQIGHGREGSCPLCGMLTEKGESRCSLRTSGTCVLCTLARQKARETSGAA